MNPVDRPLDLALALAALLRPGSELRVSVRTGGLVSDS